MAKATQASDNANVNPNLNQIERAPYELGYLLQSMPADFSAFKPQIAETCLMAKAIVSHARNANETLLSGLEAIGSILFVVSANDGFEVDKNQMASLGYLIKHLAVEAQFMQETAGNYECALREHEKRSTKKS